MTGTIQPTNIDETVKDPDPPQPPLRKKIIKVTNTRAYRWMQHAIITLAKKVETLQETVQFKTSYRSMLTTQQIQLLLIA